MGESKFRTMNCEKGQSLVELLIAIGIFVIVVSTLAFFILDSYVTGRLAQEITVANFLAEEGMEATRSIRDNSWNNLSEGSYGLAVSTTNWIFEGTEEEVDGQLQEGIRQIQIENISQDIKKITSRVTWQFTETRPQEIKLITYLTNWAKPMPPYLAQLHYRWRDDNGGE